MPASDLFGRPGEGIHQHFCGIAIWDVMFTVVAAIALACYFDVAIGRVALGLFLVGEGLHFAMGVDTAVMRALFVKAA